MLTTSYNYVTSSIAVYDYPDLLEGYGLYPVHCGDVIHINRLWTE